MKRDDDLEFVDLETEDFEEELAEKTLRFVGRVLIPFVIGLVVVIVVVAAVFLLGGKEGKEEALLASTEQTERKEEEGTENEEQESQEEPESEADVTQETSEDAAPPSEPADSAKETEGGENEAPMLQEEDPETETMSTEEGTEVDVSALLSSEAAAETDEVTFGIDVARYQGTIDWAQVAASGIDFAMVRVGYRMDESREIVADSNARYNMQEAQKNGIKLGAYFFSTAVNEEEAKAEADWTADYIAQYQITYPVAFDCEGFERESSAQYGLSATQRTDIAIRKKMHICIS